MFNFLPAEYKKTVRREYRQRLTIIWIYAISVVIAISIILTFPIYTIAKIVYQDAAKQESIEQSNINNRGVNIQDVISKVNTYMSALALIKPLQANTIAELIVSTKPVGVTITSISIANTNNGVAVSVSGVASTRDSLLLFSKNLQGVAQFSDVSLPVSYLAKDTDIEYSIQIASHVENQ